VFLLFQFTQIVVYRSPMPAEFPGYLGLTQAKFILAQQTLDLAFFSGLFTLLQPGHDAPPESSLLLPSGYRLLGKFCSSSVDQFKFARFISTLVLMRPG